MMNITDVTENGIELKVQSVNSTNTTSILL